MKYINVMLCFNRHKYIKNDEICYPGDSKLETPIRNVYNGLWGTDFMTFNHPIYRNL